MERIYPPLIRWISFILAFIQSQVTVSAAIAGSPHLCLKEIEPNRYSVSLVLDSAQDIKFFASSATLRFSSRSCNSFQELTLSRPSSETLTLTGEIQLAANCPDQIIQYSYIPTGELVYYSLQAKLQDLVRAGLAGIPVSATMANASYDLVLREARMRNMPASEIPGYVEYRMKMNQRLLAGTWAQLVPQAPAVANTACNNVDFETGDFTGWTGTTGLNPGCCLAPGIITGRQTIMSGAGLDACGGFPVVCPGGSYSVKLGDAISGALAEQIIETFTVSPASTNFTYKYAVVLQDPGHAPADQPFFKVEMLDQYGNPIPCSFYFVAAGQGIPGFQNSASCPSVVYKTWTTVSVDLSAYVSQPVMIRFTAADCTLGGHYGYAYIDGSCLPLAIASTGNVCQGGQVTLTAPAGSAAYSWSPGGQTTQSITVSTSGTYSCTLTSVQGCTMSLSIPVSIYLLPVPSFTAVASSCSPLYAFTDQSTIGSGSISSWSWSFGDGTNALIQNPLHTYSVPGSYTVSLSVISDQGCTATYSQVVTVPASPLVTFLANGVSCYGSANGSALANASGGLAPYTYSWSNNVTTASNINLSAGTYSVSVTDANGCKAAAGVTILQPVQLNISQSQTNALCFLSVNGSAQALASGGQAPYQYSWNTNPPQTSNQALNLPAGTYTLTVTDNTGCKNNTVVTITQPPALQAAILSAANISCRNGSDGMLSVQGSGGVAPYTYSWNTNPSQSGTAASGLTAGSYVVTVQDANGCLTNLAASLTEPPMLVTTAVSAATKCFGASDGSVSSSVNGGTAPYQYSWSTNPVQYTSGASNLPSGNYTIQVSDAKGCISIASVSVAQPAKLTGFVSSANPLCYGMGTGWATYSVSGGQNPYQYSWTGGTPSNGPGIQNLVAGTYVVAATDKNGCSSSAQVVISQPANLAIQISNPAQVSCYGGADGSVLGSASGGTGAYAYNWNTVPVQNVPGAQQLQAGTYTLTIHDANGCSGSKTVVITQPPVLSSAITATQPLCYGSADGIASATAGGGTSPYQYSWNTTPVQNSAYAQYLAAGSYQLIVTDAKGCTVNTQVQLSQPSKLNLQASSGDEKCFGAASGWASVAATGGFTPYNYTWNQGAHTPGLTGLLAGSYYVTVQDKNGCTQTQNIQIHQPAALVAVLQGSDATCPGGSNAWASSQVIGGSSPYIYSWSTVSMQTGSSVSGLPAGSYTVSVTDALGCRTKQTVVLSEPPAIHLQVSGSGPVCAGQAASLFVQASGGNGTFQYSWNNGLGSGASQVVYPQTTTSYIVKATDNAGCQGAPDTVAIKVISLNPGDIHLTGPGALCLGDSGSLSAQVGGVQGTISYSWSASLGSGAGPYVVKPVTSTTYTVQVSNSCGTTLWSTVQVNINPLPVVSLLSQVVSSCGRASISMSNHAPNPGAVYSWSFGDGQFSSLPAPVHQYQASGTYTISLHLISQAGCVSAGVTTDTVIVYEPTTASFEAPEKTSELIPVVPFHNTSVNAITYLWTFGDQEHAIEKDPIHTYALKGMYTVVLRTKSPKGCLDSVTKIIEITPDFSYYIPNAFTPNGDGKNDVFNGKGVEVYDFNMIIFDRWGQLIYTTDDKDAGWDGRANGGADIAQNDVYVYKIILHDFQGKRHNYEGTVTLVK
jgi:gliding motility-associated-like protein